MLANVIFPAPSSAYVISFFLPFCAVLALLTEFAVFCWFYRRVVSPPKLFGLVLAANLCSWVLGLFLSFVLPSGLVPITLGPPEHQFQSIGHGPHWLALSAVGFVWAAFLSFALEYAFFRFITRRFPRQHLVAAVAAANFASYCELAFCFYVIRW